ncbi:hypothetical protein PF049_01985 [Erythrobacteraceae bacterium WH01K]|nr:hypothetical protein PF049_01985 [Erythrobacteraceae bacterium WH01K]
MKIRHSFVASTAMVAVAATTPALAAQEMSYEQDTYEFAQPLPAGEVQPIFTSEPVVQSVPARVAPPAVTEVYEREVEIEAPTGYHGAPGVEVIHQPGHAYPAAPDYPVAHHSGPQASVHRAPAYPVNTYPAQHHAAPHHTAQQVHGGPPLPSEMAFDRTGWLDACEDELRARKERGAAGGGLFGAIAGGIIGNRVADGERLGGTLLGAGLGGIAGAAIGSAIGSAVRGNPYLRECKAYLENWERGGYRQANYGQYYGHQAYGYGYTYMPGIAYVTTHQLERPVVREIVTEEWVDVPVEQYEYETVVEHQPVHRPVQYIKQKPVRQVKYRKGK